jgi:hypothetical protein
MILRTDPIAARARSALVAAAVIGWLAGSWALFTVAMVLLLVLKSS